uniref:tRNA(Phe) (4-demethylwyosine(37)-C(7)) aminocarboxypropyltransferase n=1 Tax=Amorphochlora amoebiformis TaxID=1561963 RepID=A0A7S0H118_9EUKA
MQYCSIERQGMCVWHIAVMDAKLNAQKNGLKNVEFFDQDVGKFLSMNRNGSANGSDIHTLVLDPPRGGIAPKALKRVIGLGASQIVYVSCNPASQVRDAMVLEEAGYSLHKFSLVDQFPHTSHIETVALFRKRQPATSGSEANLLDLDRNPDILDLPDIDDRRF